jgi:hypothetical protein
VLYYEYSELMYPRQDLVTGHDFSLAAKPIKNLGVQPLFGYGNPEIAGR